MDQMTLDYQKAIKRVTKGISAAHFRNLGDVPKTMHLRVLVFLQTVPDATNSEIRAHLAEVLHKPHLQVSSVTPRVHELRECTPPLIVFNGTRLCKMTGNRVAAWRLA